MDTHNISTKHQVSSLLRVGFFLATMLLFCFHLFAKCMPFLSQGVVYGSQPLSRFMLTSVLWGGVGLMENGWHSISQLVLWLSGDLNLAAPGPNPSF